jgi:hypothetical protein
MCYIILLYHFLLLLFCFDYNFLLYRTMHHRTTKTELSGVLGVRGLLSSSMALERNMECIIEYSCAAVPEKVQGHLHSVRDSVPLFW